MTKWYQSKVFPGKKVGRTIGFPTLNLDPRLLPTGMKEGVYASRVRLGQTSYRGALYWGPRRVFQEEQRVLEIYVLNFSAEVYGQTVSFTVEEFIRGVKDFNSLPALQAQLEADVAAIKNLPTQA